jgi:predicted nucleic acid-binding protein
MVMTGVSKIFVDTNVLVYASNKLSPWYLISKQTLDIMKKEGIEIILSPQVLREYLAVTTRMASINQTDDIKGILANVETFQKEFKVVEENHFMLHKLIAILEKIPVAGKQIHDASIVAIMQHHNIQHLLTHNVDDFKRFSGLITIIPLESNALWGLAIKGA